MAGSASIEAEGELVTLEMLTSQSVIDAERPGLGVGEGAVDPGQNDMGGHGADDMGLVPDVGGAGIGRPAVGFDRRARGSRPLPPDRSGRTTETPLQSKSAFSRLPPG